MRERGHSSHTFPTIVLVLRLVVIMTRCRDGCSLFQFWIYRMEDELKAVPMPYMGSLDSVCLLVITEHSHYGLSMYTVLFRP